MYIINVQNRRRLTPLVISFSLRHAVALSNSVYVCQIVCLLGAAVYAWADRHAMNADGMSYLDMAVESLKSGPANLINGYWSPLYPALISGALFILRPAPAALFPVVHLVNLLVFGATILSFTFFIRSWLDVQQSDGADEQERVRYLIPFCFGVFAWFTMEFTRASFETPDLCVTAIVFLAAGLCCRMSLTSQWIYSFALGFTLALGYYAKAIMLPLSLILLAVLFVLPPPGKMARLKIASAALIFVLMAAPLAALISKRVGHFSIGETGTINYALYANGLPLPPSWGPGVNGTPEHLPRTILSKPIILEFATPVKGTNPLGYDPSYWFAGARPHFNLRQQWAAVKTNLRFLRGFLSEMSAIVSGALILYLLSPRGRRRQPANSLWWFVVWLAGACGVYALVHVEPRFLPGFLVLFSLALYTFLGDKADPLARTAVLGTVLLVLLIPTALHVVSAIFERPASGKPEYVLVGEALLGAGIHPGDSIAVAGGSTYETGGRAYRESSAWTAYYARYAGARVIAAIVDADDGKDMPERPAPEFWHLDQGDLARAENVLTGIGVKAIVAQDRPADSTPADWRRVSGTPYSILMLSANALR